MRKGISSSWRSSSISSSISCCLCGSLRTDSTVFFGMGDPSSWVIFGMSSWSIVFQW